MKLIKTILGFLFNQVKLISPLFLQSSNLKKIFNYYKVPDLFETSGQPNNKQLISIASGGYEAVINLAPKNIEEDLEAIWVPNKTWSSFLEKNS
jgi:hypothetical protein